MPVHLTLNAWETEQLAAHRQLVSDLLAIAREELPKHPLTQAPRRLALAASLLETFHKRCCPAGISLLLGGLADDDYRPPKVIDYINAEDSTPRGYWPSISVELLRACEDSLAYLQPLAFCYLLPAYLKLWLERPGYLCTESIFFHLCYEPEGKGKAQLMPLSQAERDIVSDIVNEYRCQAVFSDFDLLESGLLPWEHVRRQAESSDTSDYEFAEFLALEYAERTHYLSEK